MRRDDDDDLSFCGESSAAVRAAGDGGPTGVGGAPGGGAGTNSLDAAALVDDDDDDAGARCARRVAPGESGASREALGAGAMPGGALLSAASGSCRNSTDGVLVRRGDTNNDGDDVSPLFCRFEALAALRDGVASRV